MKYSDKQIEKLISGIFDGSISEYAIPEDLYLATAEYLKAGLYKGFGMNLTEAIEAGGKDLELLAQLRENIYMFSAAKNFTELKEMSALLTDGENARTFNEFRDEAMKVYDVYNQDYLKTEYNTAIGQAEMASKWIKVEDKKEFLPLLQYSAIGDACDICAPLDGMIAKVDDPVWDSVAPLNHFNCLCVLLQLDEGEPTENRADIVADVEDNMQPLFVNNAGKTGEVFTKDHPYFDVPKADKDYAKDNFNLPIPETDE